MRNTNYNYKEAVINDIIEFLQENYTTEELHELAINEEFYEKLYDEMFIDDSITGNGSGSYTFNRYTAKDYILQNLSLLCEAMKEFDCLALLGEKIESEEFEYLDVTIRCYLLGECLGIIERKYL